MLLLDCQSGCNFRFVYKAFSKLQNSITIRLFAAVQCKLNTVRHSQRSF